MSAVVGLLLGGMLSRVAGPIAQDYFENETEMGRRIQLRKEQRDIKKEQRNFEQKLKLSAIEHDRKITEMRLQNEERRKDAEVSYFRAYADANMRTFLRDCWPLRNPFDSPLAIEPIYQQNTDMVEGCKIKTIISSNQMEIVPLRFISALKNNAHPEASSINSELSMFLINNYSPNKDHAVFSEIGAWRDEIPVNDASINYLFKGLKGQPVMVFVPEFQQNGNLVRFKIWSWGLTGSQTFPDAFDFGWLDMVGLYNRVLAIESKKIIKTLKKVGLSPSSEAILKNSKIIDLFSKEKLNLTGDDRDYLIAMLDTPLEINISVRKRFAKIVSEVFEVVVAMYTDGYHLMEYGTKPQLPSLIPSLNNIPFMLPSIITYYQSLINTALMQPTISIDDALDVELTLAYNIKQTYPNKSENKELIDNIRMLNSKTDGQLHKQTVERLRLLVEPHKMLKK